MGAADRGPGELGRLAEGRHRVHGIVAGLVEARALAVVVGDALRGRHLESVQVRAPKHLCRRRWGERARGQVEHLSAVAGQRGDHEVVFVLDGRVAEDEVAEVGDAVPPGDLAAGGVEALDGDGRAPGGRESASRAHDRCSGEHAQVWNVGYGNAVALEEPGQRPQSLAGGGGEPHRLVAAERNRDDLGLGRDAGDDPGHRADLDRPEAVEVPAEVGVVSGPEQGRYLLGPSDPAGNCDVLDRRRLPRGLVQPRLVGEAAAHVGDGLEHVAVRREQRHENRLGGADGDGEAEGDLA